MARILVGTECTPDCRPVAAARQVSSPLRSAACSVAISTPAATARYPLSCVAYHRAVGRFDAQEDTRKVR